MNKYASHQESKNCECFHCLSITPHEHEDTYVNVVHLRDSYQSLLTHIKNQKEPPCTKFKCPNIEKCKREKIECKSFRFYVNNNDYSKKREKDIMISLREIV